MNLRPHHALCIQKFTGHGYDEKFTEHMKSVVSELANNRKTQITITQECDDLCKMCPNNVNGVCTSIEKVESLDKAVLDTCGLACNEQILWGDLESRARRSIFETDEFSTICACCQWFELCRDTEVCHG